MERWIDRLIYRFIDMLGIWLGIILITFGVWILLGFEVKEYFGYFVIFLGISALFIHLRQVIKRWKRVAHKFEKR
jgi:hypothetical protein